MIKKILRKICNIFGGTFRSSDYWRIRTRALASGGIVGWLYRHRHAKLLWKNGASIPLQTKFAGAPTFPHGLHGIFVSVGAEIGTNCTIFHQVTIGSNTLSDTKRPGAPIIGNNVYIGAGAKIIGGVRIGNNVRIGANCVVVKDVPDNATVVLAEPKVIVHTAPKDNRFTAWGAFSEYEEKTDVDYPLHSI